MRASRFSLSLCPLFALTTISPPALPEAGSKFSAPRVTSKVPCTVCRVLGTDQCTLDCAASRVRETGEARAGAETVEAVAADCRLMRGGAAAAESKSDTPAIAAAAKLKDFTPVIRMVVSLLLSLILRCQKLPAQSSARGQQFLGSSLSDVKGQQFREQHRISREGFEHALAQTAVISEQQHEPGDQHRPAGQFAMNALIR